MTLHSWWMTNDFKGHSADSELPEGIDGQTARSMAERSALVAHAEPRRN